MNIIQYVVLIIAIAWFSFLLIRRIFRSNNKIKIINDEIFIIKANRDKFLKIRDDIKNLSPAERMLLERNYYGVLLPELSKYVNMIDKNKMVFENIVIDKYNMLFATINHGWMSSIEINKKETNDVLIETINKHINRIIEKLSNANDKLIIKYLDNIKMLFNNELNQMIKIKYKELLNDKKSHSFMLSKFIDKSMTVFYFQCFPDEKMNIKRDLYMDSYIETTNLQFNNFLLTNNININDLSVMKNINLFHIMLFAYNNIEIDMGIFASEFSFFLLPTDLLSEKDKRQTKL